jgi:hypothetical protein
MEDGVNGWASDPSWDQAPAVGDSENPTIRWSYEVGGAISGYDNGKPNGGSLTSPVIKIPLSGASLYFRYRYKTESQSRHWDQRLVQISADNGPYQDLLQLSGDQPNTWLSSPEISLASYAGTTVRIRFSFATLDAVENRYAGWSIDDFSVQAPSMTTCSEPDNGPDNPQAISTGLLLGGMICPAGDLDEFVFDGQAGDQIGVEVSGMDPNRLDPYIYLLDSDGASILAENDDQSSGIRSDSFLSYRLPRSGKYSIRIRAWGHPGSGGPQASYTILVRKENGKPAASITTPPALTFLPASEFTLQAEAQDAGSGVSHVDFYYHSSNWSTSGWVNLGSDWNGTDGWQMPVSQSQIAEGTGQALLARVFDWAGNETTAAVWGLGMDRTPPSSALLPLPARASSTAVLLQWTGSDSVSGIATYDLQRQVCTGSTSTSALGTNSGNEADACNLWKDWLTGLTPDIDRLWMVGDLGSSYHFRMHATDRIGNTESYPSGAEASTVMPMDICSGGDAWEGDNQPSLAPLVSDTITIQQHNLCNPSGSLNDEDWLRIRLEAGQSLRVTTTPISGGAATSLQLYAGASPSSTPLAESQPSGFGGSSSLLWAAEDDIEIFLRIRPIDGRVTGDGAVYQVNVLLGYPVFMPLLDR